MTLNKEPQWIRVAGNGENMKSGGLGWRCYINLTGNEVPFDDLEVLGEISSANFRLGYDPKRDSLGLLAWLDFYGIAELVGDKLTIHIK